MPKHTWTRSHDGHRQSFRFTTDDRGDVRLTIQEVEGLLRMGGWAIDTTTEECP